MRARFTRLQLHHKGIIAQKQVGRTDVVPHNGVGPHNEELVRMALLTA